MWYFNALEIINKAIELSIMYEQGSAVHMLRGVGGSETWVLIDKDLLSKELMNDEAGQNVLLKSIHKHEPNFKVTDFTYLSNLSEEDENLYLMVWYDKDESWTYYNKDNIPSDEDLNNQFPEGYVSYYIFEKSNTITHDDYSQSRIGCNFSEIYGTFFLKK